MDQVVIRFAGDSGDGMQLTGSQFTRTTALMGNDLATFPDFPAEIRAPAGTLPGVSAFQLRFSSFDIHTPGDVPDALVAMNPAALKVHIGELKKGGILIVDQGKFRPNDLKKAHWESNPLEDETLADYRLIKVDLQKLTRETLADAPLDTRGKDRCKNMFALGMLYWLYQRDPDPSEQFLDAKFKSKPDIAEANKKALRAGYNYADITGVFQVAYRVKAATFMPPGTYRNIMGNQALCLGLVAAARKAGLRTFLGSYPITPASDVLHQLSTYKHHDVVTFQAEDEIAAVCAAIGASYSGSLGVTSTSGPGMALKSEAIGLAVMAELPLVIIDVQRAGPSTGMPTKTEQADLLQAMFGRNGECPLPIVTGSTPADCFDAAYEAVRLAVTYMTPVVLLSDGYLANGSEPWRLPKAADLPPISVRFAQPDDHPGEKFQPYRRDPKTLARPWARPGTPGLMHRIGGLEKRDGTGNIDYDPDNHEHMVHTRAAKVAGIANELAPLEVLGERQGDVLLVGWGSTRGAITGAVLRQQAQGRAVSACFLRHLNPLPNDLETLLRSFRKVLIPEMNLGQLAMLIRARYLVDAEPVTKVQGRPFTGEELDAKIQSALESCA
ncbi:MAG: 2-oxoacid:acceptor oxidoreductase subunit alpha [Planctomycetota bacterium]